MLIHGRTATGEIVAFSELGPFVPGSGPTQDTAPTSDPNPVRVGVAHTITPGTYSASGGGAISVVSEYSVNGVLYASPFTPVEGLLGQTALLKEVATETGGSSEGSRTSYINLGTIQNDPTWTVPDAFAVGDWNVYGDPV